MGIISGAFIWRDYDMGVNESRKKEFQIWLEKQLPFKKLEDISEEDIKINDNLNVRFEQWGNDEMAIELLGRPFSVYEVILNGVIGSSFFIREFEDNYAKTFVYEIHEYSPSALRSFVVYGTHNEWNSYFDDLDEHIQYKS